MQKSSFQNVNIPLSTRSPFGKHYATLTDTDNTTYFFFERRDEIYETMPQYLEYPIELQHCEVFLLADTFYKDLKRDWSKPACIQDDLKNILILT